MVGLSQRITVAVRVPDAAELAAARALLATLPLVITAQTERFQALAKASKLPYKKIDPVILIDGFFMPLNTT